jgi:hypothetical protein
MQASYADGAPPFLDWLQSAQVAGIRQSFSRKAMVSLVSSSYFPTMRIALLEGRIFSPLRRGARATTLL